jgi:hypothetical protein
MVYALIYTHVHIMVYILVYIKAYIMVYVLVYTNAYSTVYTVVLKYLGAALCSRICLPAGSAPSFEHGQCQRVLCQ